MKTPSKPSGIFKRCGCCSASWGSRSDFLSDPEVELVGYQMHCRELLAGFFLFNHSCGTTLCIPAAAFRDFYDGPIFERRLPESGECPGFCIHPESLERCPAACECAFVREILRTAGRWPKSRKPTMHSADR